MKHLRIKAAREAVQDLETKVSKETNKLKRCALREALKMAKFKLNMLKNG